MTVADLTEGHQAHCLPHLLMLRMLASDDAVAAAGAGNFTQLRRDLRRFEAPTSAIWAVQDVSR